MSNGEGVVAGQEEEVGTEELKRKVKDLEDVLIEQWEYNGEREGEQVPILKVPAKPTEKERVEHEVTHTPQKP